MENFTGTKPILIEQDIYSTIYVSNIAEDIARDIEQEQDELFQQLYDEISKNIVPVRPDRHYHRTKDLLAGDYSNTHKRSF